MLRAAFAVQRGSLLVDVDLRVEAGEVAAIVGPNGAGKTSIIRAIAGLDAIDAGEISVNGGTWASANRGDHVEPSRRSTSLVLADPLLFPHMSVLDNVSFGLRANGMSRPAAAGMARDWLERVELADFEFNKPSELSTGQQQRVSLARALAIDPEVLLLDEPLAAQDLQARASLRTQLIALLGEFTGATVFVTHDPVDAFTLSTNVIVVEEGTITQQGSPHELVQRPASPFTARLLGLNLLRGECEADVVTLEGGGVFVVADEISGPVHIAFAPHSVSLARPVALGPGPEGARVKASQRNRWTATVLELAPFQGRVRVSLSGPPSIVAEVTPQAVVELDLRVGERVEAAVKATEVEVYAV